MKRMKEPEFEEIKKAIVERWPDAEVFRDDMWLYIVSDEIGKYLGEEEERFPTGVVERYLSERFCCKECGASPDFGMIRVETYEEREMWKKYEEECRKEQEEKEEKEEEEQEGPRDNLSDGERVIFKESDEEGYVLISELTMGQIFEAYEGRNYLMGEFTFEQFMEPLVEEFERRFGEEDDIPNRTQGED